MIRRHQLLAIGGLSLALWSAVALAAFGQSTSDSYLVFPTQTASLARSQQQCAALGCDGVNTIWWWNSIGPLNASIPANVPQNAYAVEIQPSGAFGATTTNKVAKTATGLTGLEQSVLVSGTIIVPLLPIVVQTP